MEVKLDPFFLLYSFKISWEKECVQIRLTNWEKFREPLILDKAQQQAFEHDGIAGPVEIGGWGRGAINPSPPPPTVF